MAAFFPSLVENVIGFLAHLRLWSVVGLVLKGPLNLKTNVHILDLSRLLRLHRGLTESNSAETITKTFWGGSFYQKHMKYFIYGKSITSYFLVNFKRLEKIRIIDPTIAYYTEHNETICLLGKLAVIKPPAASLYTPRFNSCRKRPKKAYF